MRGIFALCPVVQLGAWTMKITNSVIKQVVSTVAGDDVVPLVLAIKDKKNVSEFKIAEMIGEQINITRNMLYRLFDNNLVHFIRKKDRKKGWYIYYWTFNMKHVQFVLVKIRRERLQRLRERLSREQASQFYLCPNACMRLDFEHAMNFQFKCAECGSLLAVHDNKRAIENIQKEIKELEDFFADMQKRQEAEVKLAKEEARKLRLKEKEKAEKMPVKKKVAKKKALKKKVATKKPVKKKVAKKKALKKKVVTKKAVKKKVSKKPAAKKDATKKGKSKVKKAVRKIVKKVRKAVKKKKK